MWLFKVAQLRCTCYVIRWNCIAWSNTIWWWSGSLSFRQFVGDVRLSSEESCHRSYLNCVVLMVLQNIGLSAKKLNDNYIRHFMPCFYNVEFV